MAVSGKHLDHLFDSVVDCLTLEVAKKFATLAIDPALQARLDELADKSTNGDLAADEQAEYESYLHALDFLTQMQAHVRGTFL